MKKLYYLGHSGSGRSVHYELLELYKQEGNKLLFHKNDIDWETGKERTMTLKAEIKTRLNFKGERVQYIDFRSSKRQYKFHFINEFEFEDDAKIEKYFIKEV